MPANAPSPTNKVDRKQTARMLLQSEIEKLPEEERAIVERFISRKHVARNVLRDFDDSRTYGERIADRVADIGGSWPFIFSFLGALLVWMLINSFLLGQKGFDPYPYILLNLLLSCVAAIQAQHDYEVNIKAELEILQVHEKLNAMRDSEIAELLDQARQVVVRLEQIEQRLDVATTSPPDAR